MTMGLPQWSRAASNLVWEDAIAGQLSLWTTTTEACTLWSPCSATRGHCLPQLEKAHRQQQRPSAAKKNYSKLLHTLHLNSPNTDIFTELYHNQRKPTDSNQRKPTDSNKDPVQPKKSYNKPLHTLHLNSPNINIFTELYL